MFADGGMPGERRLRLGPAGHPPPQAALRRASSLPAATGSAAEPGSGSPGFKLPTAPGVAPSRWL